ncbi:hypothetical protein GCM10011594_40340 [Nakamurella endophytica]|uniref:Uncharacterized protein n=1 Tax=Nakamurella endophytica TaxID=1748367 RepID=A0A917TAD9_9ACTN|nr:hypothetical protein GCM10011594_40340 [Nakamurella endophytica]
MPPLGRSRSEARQRQLVMGLRVTKSEADEIRRRAQESGLTVSALLRRTVLENVKDGDGSTCHDPVIDLAPSRPSSRAKAGET